MFKKLLNLRYTESVFDTDSNLKTNRLQIKHSYLRGAVYDVCACPVS